MISLGLLLIRIVIGGTVAAHGAQKLFGWWNGPGLEGFGGMLHKMGVRPGALWALVAAIGEFAGGILTVAGFLHPLGPFMVAGAMVVAIALVHVPNGFWNTNRGLEFPLQILAVALAISVTGYGRASLDAAIGFAPPEPATWIVLAVLTALGAGAPLALKSIQSREAARRPGLG